MEARDSLSSLGPSGLSQQLLDGETRKVGWATWLVQQVLATFAAVLILVLDNFPYGFLLFPHPGLGISLVLLSVASAQIVFACLSDLPYGLGCMIVENTPMLHSMMRSVTAMLPASQVVPTLLALYTTASLLTSVSFFLLGKFRLERVFKILPKPVLMGCIAGMGFYILTAGLGACTGIPWLWSLERLKEQAQHWPTFLLLLVLEVLLLFSLKLAKPRNLEAFVLPAFLLALIAGTWLILLGLGWTHERAQEQGWLFEDLPHTHITTLINLQVSEVAWEIFPYQVPLFCGIVIFSCLHVPVNVPGLAIYTRKRVDINKELVAHGWANLASSCCGSLQTYMVYSCSILYEKCGGGARPTGLAVGILLIACIPVTSQLVSCVPRVLAGLLLSHLGVELVKEGLLDTYRSLDVAEYVIVVVIAAVCNISFIFSLFLGLFCACVAFVVQAAHSDPVRFAFYPGRGVRSRRLRSQQELRILEDFDQRGGFLILRLHGVLFFGNTHSLPQRVRKVPARAVIIDFAQVMSIDSSAFCELDGLAETLQAQNVLLVCSGLANSKVQRHAHLARSEFHKDMDAAVAAVEQMALALHLAPMAPPPSSGGSLFADQPSQADLDFFARVCLEILQPWEVSLDAGALQGFFQFQRAPALTVLWKPGDAADFAFLLVSGHCGVLDEFSDHLVGHVETCVPGQFAGELNLFTCESRKNKLVATEDLSMWSITRSSLKRMQRDALPLAFALQSIVLRYASHRMHLSMLDGHVHTV